MQLFTELGLETGFDKGDYYTHLDSISLSGLEVDLENLDFKNLPRIVKSPYLYKYADKVLKDPTVIIEQVLIPVRSLDDAAQSRIHVQKVYGAKVGKKHDP